MLSFNFSGSSMKMLTRVSKMKLSRLVLIAGVSGLLTSAANAQFIVTYNFNDPSTTVPKLTAAKTGADAAAVTAGAFAAFGEASFNNTDDQANLNSSNSAAGVNLADALDDLAGDSGTDDYFRFTLTAANIEEFLDLSTFTIRYGGNTAGVLAYTSNLIVQSSVGGFGAGNPVLTVTPSSVSVPNVAGNYLTAATIDVSGTAFDQLSTVEFRLTFWDTSNSSARQNRFDDVVVSGSIVAVPEPTTTALLLIGGIGSLIPSRRRPR